MGVFGKMSTMLNLIEILLLVVILIYVIAKYNRFEQQYPEVKKARESVTPTVEKTIDDGVEKTIDE